MRTLIFIEIFLKKIKKANISEMFPKCGDFIRYFITNTYTVRDFLNFFQVFIPNILMCKLF